MLAWVVIFIGITGVESGFPEQFLDMTLEARISVMDGYLFFIALGTFASLLLMVFGYFRKDTPLIVHALIGVLIGVSYFGIQYSGIGDNLRPGPEFDQTVIESS